ncbi:MAG: sulfite exporter TauE/SafE family protein [Chloroflexi bacterium]|nr:sulfite exporter TauE/SafE family protein [Chloroflexota bacterium]
MPFEMTPFYVIFLPLLGMAVATLGTLVGLGGGFILVPILLFLFPEASASTVSSISLTVVFLNAASATISNYRSRRIDFKTAALLGIGAIPAAVLGAMAASRVTRNNFEVYMGIMLILGAVYVLWRSTKAAALRVNLIHTPNREIQERRGPTYRFYINTIMAAGISPVSGFVSSFFGIGGGVVNVPAMTFILKMPARLVAPTAMLLLVLTSSSSLFTRIVTNQYEEGWRRAALLGLGALVGAQIGIYLSSRVNQRVVLVILAASMILVGVRQLVVGI